MWRFLHITSFAYPQEADQAMQDTAVQFLRGLQRLLPCGACQLHWSMYLQLHPPEPACVGRLSLIDYLLQAHNYVNARTGKLQWTRSEMLAHYGNELWSRQVVSARELQDQEQKLVAAKVAGAIQERDAALRQAEAERHASSQRRQERDGVIIVAGILIIVLMVLLMVLLWRIMRRQRRSNGGNNNNGGGTGAAENKTAAAAPL